MWQTMLIATTIILIILLVVFITVPIFIIFVETEACDKMLEAVGSFLSKIFDAEVKFLKKVLRIK